MNLLNCPLGLPNPLFLLGRRGKLIGLLLLFLFPGWVHAEVYLCNQMASEDTFIAVGYQTKEGWVSEGWFLARPGRCHTFRKKLKGPFFYYFAYSKTKSQTWQGKSPFCVSTKPFQILAKNPKNLDCAAQRASEEKFRQVSLEGFKVTEVYLNPIKGPKVEAIPYEKADAETLSLWAAEGDKRATRMLRSRMKGP